MLGFWLSKYYFYFGLINICNSNKKKYIDFKNDIETLISNQEFDMLSDKFRTAAEIFYNDVVLDDQVYDNGLCSNMSDKVLSLKESINQLLYECNTKINKINDNISTYTTNKDNAYNNYYALFNRRSNK